MFRAIYEEYNLLLQQASERGKVPETVTRSFVLSSQEGQFPDEINPAAVVRLCRRVVGPVDYPEALMTSEQDVLFFTAPLANILTAPFDAIAIMDNRCYAMSESLWEGVPITFDAVLDTKTQDVTGLEDSCIIPVTFLHYITLRASLRVLPILWANEVKTAYKAERPPRQELMQFIQFQTGLLTAKVPEWEKSWMRYIYTTPRVRGIRRTQGSGRAIWTAETFATIYEGLEGDRNFAEKHNPSGVSIKRK